MIKMTEKEYRKTIIDLLFMVDSICRENKLKYMLFYGTLLGAIRHNGIIPWDDDIDIVMPREDYCKLCRIINDGDYGLTFIDINNNSETIYFVGKICDNSTWMEEVNFKHVKDYGAFIDVFPLDYAPNNSFLRLIEQKILKCMMVIETHSARTSIDYSKSIVTNIKRIIAFYICKLFSTQFLVKKINSYSSHCKKSDYYRVFGGFYFPANWLDKTKEIPFEGRMLYAPYNPDIVLKHCFGDYWELPPIEERINKHNLKCYWK